jgi:hypothetical protein
MNADDRVIPLSPALSPGNGGEGVLFHETRSLVQEVLSAFIGGFIAIRYFEVAMEIRLCD